MQMGPGLRVFAIFCEVAGRFFTSLHYEKWQRNQEYLLTDNHHNPWKKRRMHVSTKGAAILWESVNDHINEVGLCRCNCCGKWLN